MKKELFFVYIFLFSLIRGEIKEARFAGTWYPKTKHELNLKLNDLDKKASKMFPQTLKIKKVYAIITPHAAYKYSGEVAAAAYRLLPSNKFRKVIILAPSHNIRNEEIILPNYSIFKTPLGEIQIDTSIINRLNKKNLFIKKNENEHALELQLPFLQKYLKNFKIIPLIIGNLNKKQIHFAAKTLKDVIDNQTLLVVSSDFTHYGSNFNYIPFRNDIISKLKKLNMNAAQTIADKSLDKFLSFVKKTGITICGQIPIAILLNLIEDNTNIEAKTIAYSTSYAKTKNLDNIVSYMSMIFIKKDYNEEEKNILLKIARNSIKSKFTTPKKIKTKITENIKKKHGAFVTLYKKGELKGCIGRISTNQPLYKTIEEIAIASAFKDFRFKPLKESELNSIKICISILTQPQEIDSIKEIILGKHGIILSKESKSAVFLPKVAIEQKWNLIQTLEHLSLKAGLDKNEWKSPFTKFKIFESIDFCEK